MSQRAQRVACGFALALALAPLGAAAQQGPAVPQVLAAQLPARQKSAGVQVYGSLGAGWDSNPEGKTQGQGAYGGFGGLTLAKTWVTPRFSFTTSGNGRGVRYTSSVAPSRFDYGGALSTTAVLDPRTKLGLSFGANMQHNDQLFDPATSAVLLPVTRTKSLTASGDLSRQFGTRTQLALQGSWSNLRFDQQALAVPAATQAAAQAGNGSSIQNGSGISSTLNLSHTVAQRSSLSAFYAFQTNNYQYAGRVRVHTLGSGYGFGLGARSKASLSTGADAFSRQTAPGQASTGTSYSLYVAGTYGITGRKASFVSYYRRGISPSTGLAYDSILQLFSASLSGAPVSWLSFSLTGLHAVNQHDTAANKYTYPTDEASASLRARLNRGLGLTLLNEYRRRGASPNQVELTNYRVTLSVDFARTFR